jgi:hypothetical protein
LALVNGILRGARVTTPGTIYHTVRTAAGAWQPSFGLVEAQEGNNPGQFTAVGCAGVDTDLHLVGVAGFTEVWHTIRHADDGWQPSFGLVGSELQQGLPTVDCAGVGSDLHVVTIDGIANGGPIWHTIRHADGSWQPGFGVVGGSFTRVACGALGESLEVVGISGARLWRKTRFPDGSWEPTFELVPGQDDVTRPFTSVACAGVGGELQIVGVSGGQLWHTIRDAGGNWQQAFGLMESQEANDPGAFRSVACAPADGDAGQELQLVAVDAGGKLWHTIRHPDGSWQPTFGNIDGQETSDPGPFADASCGGVGSELQVTARIPQTIGFL